jgi:uncharacterized repeat protein (TIGR01451 family)/fimbrial isopeptide formation D2 family protein
VNLSLRVNLRAFARAVALAGLSVLSAGTVFAQPVPSTSLTVPASTFIGTSVSSTVTFSNTGSVAGYGPYVDLLIPAGGADGNDGLTFTGATFLGAPVTAFGPFPPAGPFTGSVVNHPLARTNTGASATVTIPPGTQLVVLQLPFGSFVPGQPPAAITVNTTMSNLADAGFPLTIQARGGFQYGADPIDNPTTDPSIFPGSFPPGSATTPTVLKTVKAYVGPEDETATGPNYPRSYTLTVSVAAGQTVTSLDVTDLIPTNVQFVSVSTVPASSAISTPSISVPGGTLTRRFASITGTAGADATVTVNFFVPRDAAGGSPVLNLSSGAPATSTDQASATGNWTPIDPRDAPGPVTSNTATHVLTDKSLALQKSIVNLDHPGATRPGDHLQITLQGQVSDFFALQNLAASDALSDGQHFDTAFTPTLAVNGNTFVLAAAGMNAANFTETRHWTGGPPTPPVNGTTDLAFRVSSELLTRGRPNGRLVGGCIPPAGTGSPATLPDCAAYNDGATAFTLVYQTVVQQNYTDTHGDGPVVQGDGVSDTASASGDVLSYSNAATPIGSNVSDGSAASVSIVQGSLAKSVYAVNGVVCSPSCGRLTAGQTVTYRLVYQLPRSSFDSFTLQDFLPLPVFDVTSGTFPSAITVFDGASGSTPAAGHAAYGATDTFHLLPAAPTPSLSVTPATNSVTFTYAAYVAAPLYPSSVVDLLFSVTVTNQPFADGLFLTNQVQSDENGSTGATQVAANIVQIQIGEPDVRITKGTVAKNDAAAVFSPAAVGPVAFNAPGTAGNRWAGTISSTGLGTSPVASVVTNVQAADLVTFAIVLENKGSGVNGAFDVRVKDTLPAGFVVPGAGLNLRVADGTGASVGFTDVGGGLFGSGIQLTDGAGGALAPFDASNGRNLVVVTYDLQVDVAATALSVLPNTATLFNFASQSGGPTFTTGRTAASSATLKGPALAKTARGPTATIGDTIDYTVTLTVPQGTMPGTTLVDTLPAGLAFVAQTGAVSSSGLAATGSTNPVVTNNGQTVTWNIGDVSNSDTNPTTNETITLTYRVVVLNVAGNHGSAPATTLQNTARLSFTGFPNVASASAPAVTVLEPALNAAKGVVVGGSGAQGDAGDSVVYTITISHAGASTAPAFDVTVSDPLPKAGSGVSLVVGPAFTALDNPGATDVSAAFTLTGADATGWTLATTGAPTLNLALGHSITITITGSLADKSLLTPNQSIVNTADVRWTSVSGNPGTISTFNPNSTERDGSGGVNTYKKTPSATITVFAPAPAKSIVATSESDTVTPTVAVGEIVRYRLAIRMAEATALNLQLVDALPAGLQYLNDGTTKVAFVCNGGVVPCMASSGPNAIAGAGLVVSGASAAVSPTFVLPGANIAAGPTFTLGDVVNSDTDADSEFVVLEFNALVLNALGNVSGTNLDNTFTVRVNGAQVGAASPAARVTVGEPAKTISKVALPTTGAGGDTIGYTVTYANTGTAPAYDVVVTDTLPALLQLQLGSVLVTPAGGASGLSNTSVGQTVAVGVAVVPAGGSFQVTYQAIIQPGGSPGQVVPNTATASLTTLPGPQGTTSNPTGSTTPVASGTVGERTYTPSAGASVTISQANLAKTILSTSEPTTTLPKVAVGEKIVYQIVVRVPDATTTTGTTLADGLPAGLAIVSLDSLTASSGSLSTSVGGGFPQVLTNARGALAAPGQAFTLSFGTLANADANTATAETLTLVYTAVVLDTAGNVRGTNQNNSATYAWTGGAGGAGSVPGSGPVVTVAEPTLQIAKSVVPATAFANDVLTYTLVVSHAAPSDATAFDAAVTDVVPAGVTYVPGSLQNVSGAAAVLDDTSAPTLKASWASLAPGVTSTLRFQAKVDATVTNGQTIVNTANVKWTSLPSDVSAPQSPFNALSTERTGSGSPVQNNYTASGSVNATVSPIADVAITKTVDNPSPAVGTNVTFAVTAKNLGPSGVTGLVVTDALPSGLVFVSALPSQGGYVPATGAWSVGSLALNASATLQIVATVTQPGVIVNTATRTASNEVDTNSSNNSGSSVVNGPPAVADIQVQKTVDNPAPTVGGNVTFTVTVRNAGPSGATGVAVTDALPAGLAFVSATPSVGSYGAGVWTIGPLALNASATLSITATVSTAGAKTNVATKSAENELDPNTGNDTGSATVVPGGGGPALADLAISKVDSPDPVRVGQNLTYTIVVSNLGPSGATSVTVTDPLPAAVVLVSATPSQGSCVGTVTCALGALPAGGTATVSVVVTPGPSAAPAISNTATVSAAETDPNPANNTATAPTTVVPVGDVGLTKVVDNPNPLVSQVVTFTIAAHNFGPSNVTGLVVNDLLPPGLALVSAVPSTGTYVPGTGVWTIGNFANGASATLTLLATVTAAGPILNTATKTQTELDTNPANDTASAAVSSTPVADLAITKTHAPASFVRGSTGTFTLTVSNGGTAATAGLVTVSDTIQAGLTPTAAAGTGWSCSVAAPLVTCTRSDALGVGGTWPPIGVTVSVSQAAPATVPNVATVGGGGDITPGNDTANDAVPIVSSADLGIVKTGPANAIPGTNVVYTLVVTNAGPSDASAVVVSDPTPANLTFVSNAGACATPFPCSLLTLPSGGTRTITTTFAVPAGYTAPSPITNTATVSSATPDPNPANDTSTALTSVAADLVVTKIVEYPVTAGAPATYRIVVTNNGPSVATNVVLTDPLPAGLTSAVVTTTQGSCTPGTTVTCTLGTMAVGGTATIRITVNLPAQLSPMRNTATVTADQFDPNTTNNSASADILGESDIPTLSEWGLMLLGLALALAGARFLKRG